MKIWRPLPEAGAAEGDVRFEGDMVWFFAGALALYRGTPCRVASYSARSAVVLGFEQHLLRPAAYLALHLQQVQPRRQVAQVPAHGLPG